MATLLSAFEHSLQVRVACKYVPAFACELAPLFPRFDTWGGLSGTWMAVTCDHPKHPSMEFLQIRYQVGGDHHRLMVRNGQEWAIRRIELLMRLLLKRLAREVRQVT